MTLTQLEYALSVLKFESFSKAAKNQSVSQPALSTQIQKLEDQIGVILFDRGANPIEVTDDGKRFLIRAEQLIANSHNLLQFSQELNSDYNGELKVGVIPTLSPFLVPLFSKSLAAEYPLFQLEINEMLTDEVIKNVRSGDLDIGIISTPITVYGIQSFPIFYERFFLYSSSKAANSKFTAAEIDIDKLWVLEEGNCFRDQINDFCHLNDTRKNQMNYRCNSIDSLMRMVDHHGGTTILPELTTIGLNEDQEMRISPIENKAREIGVITRSIVDKQRYIDALKSHILSNIPKKMKDRKGLEIVNPGIRDT
jgi:LysR family hydrogen peroxide-inducible transcriptional activator